METFCVSAAEHLRCPPRDSAVASSKEDRQAAGGAPTAEAHAGAPRAPRGDDHVSAATSRAVAETPASCPWRLNLRSEDREKTVTKHSSRTRPVTVELHVNPRGIGLAEKALVTHLALSHTWP